MPVIGRDNAIAIARKLRAEFREGGKHRLAIVVVDGRRVAQFGIRHDKTASHNYLANQIHMSLRDCLSFGECRISYEDWVARMLAKGLIEGEAPGEDAGAAAGPATDVP